MNVRILVGCVFEDNHRIIDFLARLIHHFQYHKNITVVYLRSRPDFRIDYSQAPHDALRPPDISSTIKHANFRLMPKTIGDSIESTLISLGSFHACLIYDEAFYKSNHSLLKRIAKKIYWCDPLLTRQEGSNFIQAALDLLPTTLKDDNELISLKKFCAFRNIISNRNFARATVFATGPSVENFREFDYTNSLNIYCNSTILNPDLVKAAPPLILTFADPIFHFGVSDYAHSFRESCSNFMKENEHVNIIIPMKYYYLALSLFSSFKHRIIGIPFTKNRGINFEITQDNFYTYTTSNILTLCLLPIATTFCKDVRLIGCDGRQVSEDSYFWGHGDSVQINDKMQQIKRAHPGFFNIDYNEYYFEHCHNLSRMILLAEKRGWTFSHLGFSYIPALHSRHYNTNRPTTTTCDQSTHIFVIIEPDGLASHEGHYYEWHRSLQSALKQKGIESVCAVNKGSNLYVGKSDLRVFSNHSWNVPSKLKFSSPEELMKHGTFKKFYLELNNVISHVIESKPRTNKVTLYMYYGSIMHLKSFIEIKKHYASTLTINIVCCLAYEAIRYTPEREWFLGNDGNIFRSILLESQYFFPSIKVFAMTDRFATYIFKIYDVAIPTLLHPVFGTNGTADSKRLDNASFRGSRPTIVAPGRWTMGKVPDNYINLIENLLVDSTVDVTLRRSNEDSAVLDALVDRYSNRLKLMNDSCDDKVYNAWIASADIILIPYLPNAFKMRTSGLLTDAVMHGKPIICFGPSSISDIVFKHKLGISCMNVSADSILLAANKIFCNYHLYLASIYRYKNILLDRHLMTNQVDSLLSETVDLCISS